MLMAVLFVIWLIPVGDNRTGTVAKFASLGHEYRLVSWELENVLGKWSHRLWTILPWTPTSEADRRASLDRYISLVEEYRLADDLLDNIASAIDPDIQLLNDTQRKVDQLVIERDEIRDGLEEYLEQTISEIVRTDDVGLVGSFVWPPVDFRIDSPPKLLVTSPRDEIRRVEGILIDPDISVEETLRIERELAELHGVSTWLIHSC